MSHYVELHCHSCFSLLDGASTPEALLDRAQALGMGALALTDHNGLYAIIRFSLAAQERGIKPIVGTELSLSDDTHLTLLAENDEGYRNLCWLISRAQLNEEKGFARLLWDQFAGHTRGLIALTGCRQGAVLKQLVAGDRQNALAILRRIKETFDAQVYVELQNHWHPDDTALLSRLTELAQIVSLPIVATNNVHYAHREGYRLQDTLVAIRHNQPLQDCRRYLRPNSEYYLKPFAEIAPLFASYPEALANTLEIAGRCQVALDFRQEALSPQMWGLDDSADKRLMDLCALALHQSYPKDARAAKQQLEHELAVIRETKLAGYFMLVWDIVRFARERGIQVRGRGSAANSIVAYLLGITGVDPLAHGLLFERFLSSEARVMPDIDLDFCAKRREEVIQYVYERYGESHVGMVCNYVTYRERSAIRDVGKALGLGADTINLLAKSKGKWGSHNLWGNDAAEAESAQPSSQKDIPSFGDRAMPEIPVQTWKQFVVLCDQIQGYPRHLSIHVGGMCITRAPLDEIVPLERATMPGRVVIQWDKDNVEDAGLIKIDLLSLRTLAAIDECLRTIRQTRGEVVDLDALALDDRAVYDALQRADTIGAFQVESRAQQQALVQMKPRSFADIVVEVSLIRPGPLQGNMVHPYFRRRQGREPVTYFHPLLEPILAETLGIVVFQEQVIRIAMVMGQFSAGEADLLRRAMSRHRGEEEMAHFRQRFVAGAIARGVPQTVANEVFDKLAGFASYGFCKSHAAAFAKTAYDTLYLRAHYAAEFYCAILNNEPMGFYAPRVVIGDAKRHRVRILPVHINQSLATCTIEDGAIRLGFAYVDGLGEASLERLVKARPPKGYRSLDELCHRTRLPRKLIENLILAGGLATWSNNKRMLLWDLGRIHYQAEELPLPMAPDDVTLETMTYGEELAYEYGVTGVLAQGHIMELFRARLEKASISTSQDLVLMRAGQRVRVAGLVAVRQAPPTAKGFVFYTLEDEWGMINVIVRPDVFSSQRETLVTACVLVIQGTVQRGSGQVNILAERGWKLC